MTTRTTAVADAAVGAEASGEVAATAEASVAASAEASVAVAEVAEDSAASAAQVGAASGAPSAAPGPGEVAEEEGGRRRARAPPAVGRELRLRWRWPHSKEGKMQQGIGKRKKKEE